jgi:chorismate mutase
MKHLATHKSLKAARSKIDKIDRKIITQLAARMRVCHKIGLIKSKGKIPVIQKARWNDVMKDRLKYSKKLGLTLQTVDRIFKLIQKESIAVQKKVKKK